MSPEEIQAMAKGLAEGQAAWYVLSAVLGGLMTGLGAHLAEKGKNRATKEDIGEITKAVEAAKIEFSRQLEDLKAHHQLRMVAADRRLQAHQDAYALISELQLSIRYSKDTWGPLAQNAHSWLRHNYIFMGKETRNSFTRALHGFELFRGQMYWMERDSIDWSQVDFGAEHEKLKKIWDEEIEPVFKVITSEVELPTLSMLYPMPSPVKFR